PTQPPPQPPPPQPPDWSSPPTTASNKPVVVLGRMHSEPERSLPLVEFRPLEPPAPPNYRSCPEIGPQIQVVQFAGTGGGGAGGLHRDNEIAEIAADSMRINGALRHFKHLRKPTSTLSIPAAMKVRAPLFAS
ncbi:potassium intermediate small conductance calcium-activated channel, putative, partial [Ixodes scapularis]